MRALAIHFSLEFFTGLRNKTLLLMNYLLPLGFYAMMGLMMAEINPLFLETMIPAVIVFAVLSSMILGLPQPLAEAREAGIFRTYKINGIPALSIVAMPALSAFIHSTLVSLIIVITGPVFFSAPVPQGFPTVLVILVALSFAVAGLGTLIGVISNNARATILWSQLIYLPSMMLSGMMVPSSMLPEGLARVARLLPATWAMDAFSAFTMGGDVGYNPLWAVAILTLTGSLGFALSLHLFRWDQHSETRGYLAILVLLPLILGAFLLPLAPKAIFAF